MEKSFGKLINLFLEWQESFKNYKTEYCGDGNQLISFLEPTKPFLSKLFGHQLYYWKPIAFIPHFDDQEIVVFSPNSSLDKFLEEVAHQMLKEKIKISIKRDY